MPVITKPARQPEGVTLAATLVGNLVRIELLHVLHAGPATCSELVGLVGGSQSQIDRHLAGLRAAGLVIGTPDRTQGKVPVTRWSVDPGAVERLFDQVRRYATGSA